MRLCLLSAACLLSGLLAMSPARAHAWTCQPVAVAPMASMPGCDYGVPVRSEGRLLVPRVCRVDVGTQKVERHTVEVRNALTLERTLQASLPASPVREGKPMPAVGQILGGPYPLFVHAGGIAAIDARQGRLEPVFEPTGRLRGVARLGDVLALVEELPKAEGVEASLAWTILDYESGQVLGEVPLAGTGLQGLAVRKVGDVVEAVVEREIKGQSGRPGELVVVVRDKDGKPRLGKDGALEVQWRQIATAKGQTVQAAAATCPLLDEAAAVLVDAPALVLSADPTRAHVATSTVQAQTQGLTGMCAAMLPPAEEGRALVWLDLGAGKLELRRVDCRPEP